MEAVRARRRLADPRLIEPRFYYDLASAETYRWPSARCMRWCAVPSDPVVSGKLAFRCAEEVALSARTSSAAGGAGSDAAALARAVPRTMCAGRPSPRRTRSGSARRGRRLAALRQAFAAAVTSRTRQRSDRRRRVPRGTARRDQGRRASSTARALEEANERARGATASTTCAAIWVDGRVLAGERRSRPMVPSGILEGVAR